MSETVIALSNVRKSYGKHQVLSDVNMTVNKGDIYGLVGKNGAGKTTIFKVILGLSEFDSGSLSIMGRLRPLAPKRDRYASMLVSSTRTP